MITSIARLLAMPVLLAGAFLTACSLGGPGIKSRFYTLSSHAGEPLDPPSGSTRHSAGVGPIELPELYQRPQIVSRPQDNIVELAEFERWGGALRGQIQQVLVQNLMSRLDTSQLRAWPWQRVETPALQVTVRFFRFDGEPGGRVYLAGLWQLADAHADCRLEGHRFEIVRQTEGPGYPYYVEALSRGLAGLSQEIAARLVVASPGCER